MFTLSKKVAQNWADEGAQAEDYKVRAPVRGVAKASLVALFPDPFQLFKVFFHQAVVDALLRHTRAVMALPVIPALKITDQGLFDVEKFSFIN